MLPRKRRGTAGVPRIILVGNNPVAMNVEQNINPKSATDIRSTESNDAIRAPYLSEDDLEAMGRRIGSQRSIDLPGYTAFDFISRQRENEREILTAYRSTLAAVESGELITPAAEWLADNHYIVEKNIREVERDLPTRFYRQLPSLEVQGKGQIPCVMALAWLYVAHMHSTISLNSLSRLVNGYQSERTLQIGELWALPSMLRFVLIENLRRISQRVERARRMRRRANQAADQLLRLEPGQSCRQILADIADVTDDNPFAAQLLYRLRDGTQTSKEALTWLEDKLEARGSDAEEVLVSEHNRLASGNVTMGNIIRGLRKIDDIDWTEWFEQMSEVDRELRESTNLAELDFASRDLYRQSVEKLAQRSGKSEIEVARAAIRLAGGDASGTERREPKDIGFFLIGRDRHLLEEKIDYRPRFRESVKRAYSRLGLLGIAGPIAGLSIIILAIVASFLVHLGLSAWTIIVLVALFALPSSEAASGLFNTVATLLMLPTRLVGFEYEEGIPEESRTLVAIPCLIGSRDTVDELVRNLEVHYLATTRGEAYFALLSDWPDSPTEESAADRDLLRYATAEIEKLNDRHSEEGASRFFLLHRRRVHNASEGVWMGWERKRGKLHELNQLLRGDPDTTFVASDDALPEDIRYVMTLDADTRLTRDAVTRLVGKMAHPCNAPVIDPETQTVTSGHGILQPRVTPSLTTGEEASAFQRIFSVNRGLDPYVFTISDVYQDLLGEGTFTGKGLYQVDAFEAALKGRIGENEVLSHDLLEGSLARCGLATDVELVEDFPVRYDVEVSRQHRWARGDWQLLPFIFGSAGHIPVLGRWKMLDNLRRSSTPIAWVAASILGWCTMPVGAATVWQAVLIFSLVVAPTLSLISSAFPRRSDIVAMAHLHGVFSELSAANAQVALRIVFIGHTAYVMADAIVRTLYRLFVSHRHMLEWRTAAQAHSAGNLSIAGSYREMWQAPAVAVLGLALALIFGHGGGYVAIPFAILWALSPAIAWFVSQSAETEDRLKISVRSGDELRQYARRTWRFFEEFANAENNDLPPDNFQEDPVPLVAHRTSPTNIGVYLLSTISARDFGWIGLADTIGRLERTVATIDKMGKFRGHLFNWYDTKTLEPLRPRYVSAVDSGNLAGHLVTVSSACAEWGQALSAHLDAGIDGIADTASILSNELAALADDRRTVRPLRRRVEERIAGFHSAIETLRKQPEFVSIRSINLTVLAREIHRLTTNLDHEVSTRESASLVDWAAALFKTCEAHVADSMSEPHDIENFRARLNTLREHTRALAFGMDFAFLLRQERRLLSIGYRVEDGELDEACYDLLASEARLTSLFGIAKGDLPTEHWFRLGRPVVSVGSMAALVSWSGSMFEYLMPPLVMEERQGSILNQSSVLAIRRQMSYARQLGTPWGISESAFNARDHNLNYQYSNFGVPSLGLKRGLAQNAVIAPYASLLATQYAPEEALANLQKLQKLGALGRYGFHDAVDFTPTRVPEGETCAVVYNYMAHHQGMSITAVANVIFNGRLRARFHSDPVIEAVELLLQEKAPREIPILTINREPQDAKPAETQQLERPEIRSIVDPIAADRATVLLSNGHYSVMLTATGAGYSRWNGQAVTRWQPDPAEDRWGSFIFLRDTRSGDWWSATAEPRRAPGEKANVLFSDDKAVFYKTVGNIRSEVDCIVATEYDAEARRVTIFNDGEDDRFIEVTSYAEVVVAPDDADAAHPAFSKMFVKTEIGPKRDVIYAERRKRSPSDPDMAVAHLIVGGSGAGSGRENQAETDRRVFLGRGRQLCEAQAFDDGARLTGSDGFTLDPVFALRRVVRVPAGKKASLIFWTIAAPTRSAAEAAVERYRYSESFQHETTHAWTRSQVQLRYVDLSSQEAASFQMLARYLMYPDLRLRPDQEQVRNGLGPQSALWPLAISGDFPIFALRINDEVDLDMVTKALRGQEYLRGRGLVADLVIVNEKPSSYIQDLQTAIDAMCENSKLRGQALGPSQHIFAVRRDLMEPESYNALLSSARIVLHARNGKFSDQLERAEEISGVIETREESRREEVVEEGEAVMRPLAELRPTRRRAPVGEPIPGDGLSLWNGYGGFAPDGRSYVVRLRGGETTPHPWINVISNEHFGFHVSAEGAGFTWSRNSRDFQLTPWSNDPVVNRPGEALYIADLDGGSVFTPLAALSQDPERQFEARHGLGYSTFATETDGLRVELTQTVDREDAVKFSHVAVTNSGDRERHFRIYFYAEWVLGSIRAKTAPYIVSTIDDGEVLSAGNPYSIDYAKRRAFVAASRPLSSFTADRRSFLGVAGDVFFPQAPLSRETLNRSTAIDGDPCAALAVDLRVAPGATETVLFLMGDAGSEAEAGELARKHRDRAAAEAVSTASRQWDDFTGALQVETPDESLNHLVNAWLPYQSLSCRLMARTAFYQASGAFGFRDQLQDTLAYMVHDPALARRQILNAAGRQFEAGDVQHWWLPGSGAGVRTRIADDVVWLAYALSEYLGVTGDRSILDEKLAYLTGQDLQPAEHDAFFQPGQSPHDATVYEHAAKALDLAIERTGANGLPLFLGGDWNDGMNRVGQDGRGESVWLGWFLLHALNAFAPCAEERKDTGRTERWRSHAGSLKSALESVAWDGTHYKRGFFDDGTPLGSSQSEECKIDSIAQSWSVLSGDFDPERATTAMDSVLRDLVDREAGIVRLFVPPFENTDKDPGYIQAYPPGVRENGGQYTHAATWVVCALAALGRGDDAYECFSMLNPLAHARDRQAAELYRVEPYVVAADIYGRAPYAGRGGWTWYTGSAGWLYRAAVEGILGIRISQGHLIVRPVLPSGWNGFRSTLRHAGTDYAIDVTRAENGDLEISVNGERVADATVGYPLKGATEQKDGRRHLRVV